MPGARSASGRESGREGCEGPTGNPRPRSPPLASNPSSRDGQPALHVRTIHGVHCPGRGTAETRSGIDERHETVDEVGGDLRFHPQPKEDDGTTRAALEAGDLLTPALDIIFECFQQGAGMGTSAAWGRDGETC